MGKYRLHERPYTAKSFSEKAYPTIKDSLEKAESVLKPLKTYGVEPYYEGNDFVAKRMEGACGRTLGSQYMTVGANPEVRGWKKALAATVGHEYNHVARLQYTGRKDWARYTLLDNIASEGLAQNFERLVYGRRAPYSVGMSDKEAEKVARKIEPLIHLKDKRLYRDFFFGSKDGKFRHWEGYKFSFKKVGERIDELMYERDATWPELMRMSSAEITGMGD